MKKSLIASLVGISLLASANLASASTVYSGSVINATPSACCGLTAPLLLDQSGLSSNYVSGVTNFETFTSSNPTHLGTSGTPSTSGYFALAGAFVDIDLGSTLTLTKLALWNDNDYQGVKNFNLLISDNALFTGATSLGSFTATYGVGNAFLDYQIGIDVQLFDLIDAT
ncbi:MAG: hypothetical protein J0L97_09235, partial [Alphaproteobacteria bacterium]|nr:hypothetical protein [Alphaproteobacteria bacterium]